MITLILVVLLTVGFLLIRKRDKGIQRRFNEAVLGLVLDIGLLVKEKTAEETKENASS